MFASGWTYSCFAPIRNGGGRGRTWLATAIWYGKTRAKIDRRKTKERDTQASKNTDAQCRGVARLSMPMALAVEVGEVT